MSENEKKRISRREMLKMGALAGAVSLVSGSITRGVARAGEDGKGEAEESLPQVPRRLLGKTGQTVPILLMGGAMSLDKRFDPKLAEGLRFGANYIDAADCYAGGTCEPAVGNFHTRIDARDKIWITSKSDRHDPKGLEATLHLGLEKMKTDYVDMYFLHALQDGSVINKELMETVERLKKEGKIRHFGFSCHDGNVAELLHQAAETPWIEAVMFRYNFRQYGNAELNTAMDACVKSKVGLIAMKTQSSEASFAEAWKKYAQPGKWSKHQAVLKAVWADERISAAVSHMDTFDKLKQNIAAALDQFELGQAEYDALYEYANATRGEACDGCEQICNPSVAAPVRIGTTLRYLMYHDVYGEKAKAKELFRRMPSEAQGLSGVDFRPANRACPHGVDVAKQMRRAAEVFEA